VAACTKRCSVLYRVRPTLTLGLDVMDLDPRLLTDHAPEISVELRIKLDGFREGHGSPYYFVRVSVSQRLTGIAGHL
jgi:hypothetical protein